MSADSLQTSGTPLFVPAFGPADGQHRVLELIATGAPLDEILTRICLLVEAQEPGLRCSIVPAAPDGRGAGPSLPAVFMAGFNVSHGLRAARSLPVRGGDGRVIASVALFRAGADDDADVDRTRLDMATHLAGIAIERDAQRARDRELAAAAQLAQTRTRLLLDAAALMLAADDPDRMLQRLFERLAPELGLDTFFNYMVDESGEAMTLACWAGVPDETAHGIRTLGFGVAICGTVAQLRAPLVHARIHEDELPRVQLVRSFGIRAYACNPLMVGEELLGTLSFASRSRDEFSADEVDFLASICRYVASAYERLRLVARLREADRRKDEFLATIGHELRNPLAPLRNGLEILGLPGADAAVAARARAMMDRQLRQIVRLVDDLTDVSRATRGRIELRLRPFDLRAAVEQAIEASLPAITAGGHSLSTELPDAPLVLAADQARIAQVVSNLLNNAAKYTLPGGRIALALAREEGEAVIRVRDNGLGIAREMLPQIFDMFTQVNRTFDRAQGGLGIGLALSRTLVQLHGGALLAFSGGADAGSEFVVRLPAAADAVAAPPEALELAPTGRRVLVVDDNADAAESLCTLLRLRGHETTAAADGPQALALAGRLAPEIAFVDLSMPGMDGFEVARRLRAAPGGDALLLVALTGLGQEHDRAATARAGFDAHLTKPGDLQALEQLLASDRLRAR
jgi:signal transduction histidine kinase/ActR/RegA family two-component response regulator